MRALYNDIEDYTTKLLAMRIKDGWLPDGDVSSEDIRTLCETDLSKFNHVHLFAGIGGFPLACRIAGLPDVFRILTGGFPCQPFSHAGQRHGANDNRYLWPQTLTALKSHRPDVAVFENVVGLVSMAFPGDETLVDLQALTAGLRDYHYKTEALAVANAICCDIEEAGYSVAPIVIPACGVNAKHQRYRLWFVCISNTYTDNQRGTKPESQYERAKDGDGGRENGLGAGDDVADAESGAIRPGLQKQEPRGGRGQSADSGRQSRGPDVPDADGSRLQRVAVKKRNRQDRPQSGNKLARGLRDVSFRPSGQCERATQSRMGRETHGLSQRLDPSRAFGPEWEAGVARVISGFEGRADRIKGLGNAIVPQVAAEIIMLLMRALDIEPSWKMAE